MKLFKLLDELIEGKFLSKSKTKHFNNANEYFDLNDKIYEFNSIPDNDLCFPEEVVNRYSYDSGLLGPEIYKEFCRIFGKNDWKCSGFFKLKPGGICGWHTNSNETNERIYLVRAEESNKSFFKYKLGDVEKTIWEKSGWQVNRFTPTSKPPYLWHCVGSETTRWSLGFRKETHKLKSTHSASVEEYGDWRFDNQKEPSLRINISILKQKGFLSDDNIRIINHKDIAFKGFNFDHRRRGVNCICCDGKRYKKCNTSFPGILIKGQNKFNKKYRMIDGKHRITKLIDSGIENSKFYVLNYKDIEKYIESANNPISAFGYTMAPGTPDFNFQLEYKKKKEALRGQTKESK